MTGLRLRLAGYRWELVLVVCIFVAAYAASQLSPYYLDPAQILSQMRFVIIPGLIALALAVIVIQGEIDISLPSTVAVGTVMLAILSNNGVPYFVAVPLVLLAGSLLGLLNGAIVTSFGLPSMAVTLGTMGAFRGLAYLLPGGETGYAANVFDPAYLWLGKTKLFGILPASLILLLIAAVLIGLLVHRTTYGRLSFAIGNNAVATRFSGTRVGRVKVAAYVLAGFMAAIGSLVFVGQYESARGDNFDGQLLFCVAAVALGGVDMNGGRGKIVGVVLSILLLGTMYNGMGLANVQAPVQVIVFGGLLILSILIPMIAGALRSRVAARRFPRAGAA